MFSALRFYFLFQVFYLKWHSPSSAWTASRRRTLRRTCRPSAAFHSRLTLASAAEEIDAVDGMEHCVAVNAVVLRVATLHCVDCAAEVALFVQNVVQLKRQCQGVSFEEALA